MAEASSFYEIFGAQLVIPEQRFLFDYWRGRHCGDRPPGRPQIDPIDFVPLWPGISLVETGQGYRIRHAGTQLRDIFGREMTGGNLDDFFQGAERAYWVSALDHVAKTGRPAQGAASLSAWGNDHQFQFWLRLPLMDEEGRVAMILGYDAFLHAETHPTFLTIVSVGQPALTIVKKVG